MKNGFEFLGKIFNKNIGNFFQFFSLILEAIAMTDNIEIKVNQFIFKPFLLHAPQARKFLGIVHRKHEIVKYNIYTGNLFNTVHYGLESQND